MNSDSGRELVLALDRQFLKIHEGSVALISSFQNRELRPESVVEPKTTQQAVVFDRVVRSAAIVEQTFSGISVNLWDDPFEWTLPEALGSIQRVLEYLREVEETRLRTFTLFRSDSDLKREIGVPQGGTIPLANIVIDALSRAALVQGEAHGIYRALTGDVLAGFNRRV